MDSISTADSQVTTPPAVTFADLVPDAALVAALGAQGITKPTDVQVVALPEVMAGNDLIVQAQTGSGKTLAYAIPLILKIRAMDQRSTVGIIIAPTRELAIQVSRVIASIAPEVHPACIIGGASAKEQIDDLGEDRRIIVGTPGRLLDLIRRREISLNKCSYFVLDEADEMLSMGFLEEVRTILSRLPDKRQGLFISATITARVQMLAQSFLSKPKQLVVYGGAEVAPNVKHLYCEVSEELSAKAVALCDLIETERPRSAIVFCNTKSDTELVEVFLRRRGFDARRLNSDLSQRERDQVMKKIRAGDLQILIATDVAGRGIDIEQIDMVVNYAVHDLPEVYMHRTGRTGRAGRSGRAITLVAPHDFSQFYNLRKRVELTFEKLDPPSQEEVMKARLSHFYEMLRTTAIEVSDKDRLIARQLVVDLADIAEPGEEIVGVLSKLYSLAMQSLMKQTRPSLEEELGQPEIVRPSEPRREEGRGSFSSSRDRDRDRGDRGSFRGDDRGGRRGGGGRQQGRGRR